MSDTSKYTRKEIRDYIVAEITRGKDLEEVQAGLNREFGIKRVLNLFTTSIKEQ